MEKVILYFQVSVEVEVPEDIEEDELIEEGLRVIAENPPLLYLSSENYMYAETLKE